MASLFHVVVWKQKFKFKCRCVFGGIYFGVIFTKQLELPFVPMWLGTVAFTATEIKTIPTD